MKNQIERAEPSRGAPDHRDTVRSHPEYPRMVEAVNKHFPAGRANSGYAIEAIYDFVTSRESGHVVLLEACKAAKREMVGLAAYMETCEPSVIVDNLPSLAKALNLKVDAIEAAIQKAGGI